VAGVPVGWAAVLRTGESSSGEEKQAPMSRVMRKFSIGFQGRGTGKVST